MDVSQRIALLQELVRCDSEISTWCYDANGCLLSSNCTEEAVFATAFSVFGTKDTMMQYAAANDNPIILGTGLGIVWAAAFERENGQLKRAFVLGPVFYTEVSLRQIEQSYAVYGNLELSIAWKSQMLNAMQRVPTVPNMIISRYALMLHYCVTQQRLTASDLYLPTEHLRFDTQQEKPMEKDRHKVYAAERAMLQMVRNGDLNYKQALSTSQLISNGVPVQGQGVLRQSKVSVIVFCSLVCRAAIEGGLSPEEAYALGDSYIQASESAKDLDVLKSIPNMMYDDFVRRVHCCRTNPKLSASIRRCCDAIEMHLDAKITARQLANLVGYTEYYLTHKFKNETGFCVNDYAKFAKTERAKVLLHNTELSIQEISDQLGFSSRNYFSRVFCEVVGCTPTMFRARPEQA
ncbi:MAG: helix-turn-helix domain-containing protein [Ruthenibacterium sp.]